MRHRPELKLSEIRPGTAAVLVGAVVACAIAVMAWNYAVHVKWSNGELSMGPAPDQAVSPPPESAKLPEK
jgi:hypothetical protein